MAFPTPLYVLTKDGLYMPITGALCKSSVDFLFYDGETYRDELDAGFLGNPHSTFSRQNDAQAADALPPPGATYADLITELSVDGSGTASESSLGAAFVNGASALIQAKKDLVSGVLNPTMLPGNDPPLVGLLGKGAITTYAPSLLADAAFNESDSYGHVLPRWKPKIRTLFQWWDSATPGQAMTFTGTTVLNDPNLTLSSARPLLVGQLLSGAGIPSGARIVEIKRATKFVASASLVSLLATEVVMSHQATAGATVEVTASGGNIVGECWADEFLMCAGGVPLRV